MAERLVGRVAIVTGASRGIGEAAALALAREGARLVVASRREGAIAEAAARINDAVPGAAVGRACHVGHPDEVEALVAFTADEVGLPDVLVNNAATNPYFGPLVGAPWPAWDKTFEVNLKGPFAASRAVAQRLVEAGRRGSIVNIASILGRHPAPLQGVYAMTKAALISMTRTLAHELGSAGIRVNAVCPGLVATRLAEAITSDPALAEHYTQRAALGRYAAPDEIAGLIVYLASDEASYVTGQAIDIDGGYA